jgi:two-component system, NarL family, response regulator LiaR
MSAAYAPQYGLASSATRWPDADPTPIAHALTNSGQSTARVLIVSRQPIVRHGLQALLQGQPDLAVIGEADDGAEAVRLARQLRPSLVLIDLTTRAIDGLSATRSICAELRDTRVIVMLGDNDDVAAVESVRAGAVACLRRDARVEDLLHAIRSADSDQVVLPTRAAARLVRSMGRHEALSERETEVMFLIARGLANKQVARELGITQSTVKCHVSGILTKLGLPSRTQVALYAARTGLVALDQGGTDEDAEFLGNSLSA